MYPSKIKCNGMKLSLLEKIYRKSFEILECSAADKTVESGKLRQSKNMLVGMRNKIYHIPLLFTLYCNSELLRGYI
jgi:hypothetical protein